MPAYQVTVTKTYRFGVDCENMLRARLSALDVLRDLEGAIAAEVNVTVDEEIPQEEITEVDPYRPE